ncbi:DNA mismatch repair endonuclease MutL [Methanoregula sp.]|uniref:DNA mismatch repair endonuclease MutL n=1 Tax=Methanoregula sp. TaxID=2052170 RepID=UPI002CC63DAB|nr:DNA mismatch repair endonuclease MutL [Methanoregula sp.]HVP96008.1 DNA mismatch repair endonuclease MutL [Methanoregula sp.]
MTAEEHSPVIRVLDPATVNQIAAGEVIERPASVVKELVENAIDAGARTVRIDITSVQGGIAAIKVTDDGCGMQPADAELAFVPHATSKIRKLDDLFSIHTLGFRGEALASIAAIAKVTLVTRPQGSGRMPGTRIVVVGGEITTRGKTGAPEGTSVLVEELFFNTPARKKFQKSLTTEIARIHGILEGLCLACPQVSFRFFHNNREQLVTERTGRSLDTIARIFGNDYARELIPVAADLPFMRISGYVSRPALSRKDHDRILIAINGRYITAPSLTTAIREGYGTLLPHGRYPVAFLSLAIDTRLVDINVHPTKKEVRLTKEKEIAEGVRDSVRAALATGDLIPEVTAPQPVYQNLDAGESDTLPVPYVAEPADPYCAGTITVPAVPGTLSPFTEPTHSGTALTDSRLRQTELASGIPPVTAVVPEMDVIGQIGGIYILAEAANGELIIIDQHAAHERIFYEQVSRSMAARQAQELLVPAIIHRPPKDAAILKSLIPALAQEGVIIEEFGAGSFLVRAVPALMGKVEGPAMIDDLVSDLLHKDMDRPVSDRERLTRIIACRSAIKAGTVCTIEQCRRIISQLRATKMPFTCPHGRPTMIRFTRGKLDELFGRT